MLWAWMARSQCLSTVIKFVYLITCDLRHCATIWTVNVCCFVLCIYIGVGLPILAPGLNLKRVAYQLVGQKTHDLLTLTLCRLENPVCTRKVMLIISCDVWVCDAGVKDLTSNHLISCCWHAKRYYIYNSFSYGNTKCARAKRTLPAIFFLYIYT